MFCVCSVSRSSDDVYKGVVDVFCHAMPISTDEYVGVLVDNHVVEFLSVLCHEVLDILLVCVLSRFCNEELRQRSFFFKRFKFFSIEEILCDLPAAKEEPAWFCMIGGGHHAATLLQKSSEWCDAGSWAYQNPRNVQTGWCRKRSSSA